MAEDIDKSGGTAKAPDAAHSTSESKSALPAVESPPLSPAGAEPSVAPEPKIEPAASPVDGGEALPLPAAARARFKARHKRQAVLAASVTVAACIGAIIGALAMNGMASPRPDTAALGERQAMRQSIDQLNKQIAALKADVDAGTKSARSQIAKISERLNRPSEPATTGSIAPGPAATVPTPVPRPETRPVVLHDWRIYDVHNGFVAVAGHGDIYEIGIGAPLPGLGPVQQIKRQDGRWVVVTPKGLIVSLRDRRYFEAN
ncbi:MAG TPA: hypothetical protein VFB31_14270 [Pseudolabrys sp.]|nr:hypothetical protein [Pseudolabrys sp.]